MSPLQGCKAAAGPGWLIYSQHCQGESRACLGRWQSLLCTGHLAMRPCCPPQALQLDNPVPVPKPLGKGTFKQGHHG